MSLIIIALLLILLLADAYIFFFVLPGLLASWAGTPKVLFVCLLLLPTAIYCMTAVRALTTDDIGQPLLDNLLRATLLVLFPTLIFALISLIGKGIGLFWTPGRNVADIVGLSAAALWLGIALYGCISGWKKITVENVTIASDRIPEAFDGYRIVQLSDFHIGTYSSVPATVDRIVDRVNSLEPDLIVFTGDLVNSSASEIDMFKEALSRLRAKDGVYSVLGNHDYCLYRRYVAPDSPARQLAKVVENEKEIGWRMLRNESVRIRRGNDSIALAGVDNAGGRRFTDRSDLGAATRGLAPGEFKILLSHDPSHWRREVLPASDIDLMLAGHTHAMQFRIGGRSPAAWVYREWGGLYSEGDRRLYVSTGIGENIAFRFGAWPRIETITLRSLPAAPDDKRQSQ